MGETPSLGRRGFISRTSLVTSKRGRFRSLAIKIVVEEKSAKASVMQKCRNSRLEEAVRRKKEGESQYGKGPIKTTVKRETGWGKCS